MQLSKFELLLDSFDKLPKPNFDTTFMDICKYPGSRFEEVCSRILSFYFQPKNEHGLNDLLLSSLFELISENEILYSSNQITVLIEEDASGKRLDLLIFSPDFTIGIENKISASVYNPLETYKKRIDQFNSDNVFKVVLSIHKVTKVDEKKSIKENGFINITYNQLFQVLKSKVGDYISDGRNKYLIYLYDFIKTLENMKDENPMNNELSDFFFSNSNRIENLIDLFNKNNTKILEIQKNKIEEIRTSISQKTNDKKWWVWQGWDLGYNDFNENDSKIGIESNFKTTKRNPLGEFQIYISTWKLKDWHHFEDLIVKKYSGKDITKIGGKVSMQVENIVGYDKDLILEKLQGYYDFLSSITKQTT